MEIMQSCVEYKRFVASKIRAARVIRYRPWVRAYDAGI